MSWLSEVQAKAHLLHEQIAHVASAAELSGALPEQIQALTAPYYEMLEELYRNEYAFAYTLDASDLVVRFQGPAVETDAPELATVTEAFAKLRLHVERIARAIVGLAAGDRATTPPGVQLRLSGLARGSLVVGLRVSDAHDLPKGETHLLLGNEDPIFQTVREAVRQLAIVPQFLTAEGLSDSIADAIPDPGVRDAVLVAASKLSPSGKRGIDAVSIYSSATAPGVTPEALTPKAGRLIRRSLAKPLRSTETGDFEGIVREMDLDVRRFEIRHVPSIGAIRCIYPVDLTRQAHTWLNQRVRVSGVFQRGQNGLPRLIQVSSLTVVADESPPTQLGLGTNHPDEGTW